MSETARSYGGISLGSGRARPRRFRFRTVVLGLLLVLLAYAVWITRDTHAVSEFIPSNPKYWVAVTDIAGKRAKIAESDVLKSLSRGFDLAALNRILNTEVSAPRWVVNNLAGQTCFITGNDIQDFSDILVISKMTRIGTLLERAYGFSSKVTREHAGGLDLRRLDGQDVYYAARGRVLIVTRDREALIHALTLPPDREPHDPSLVRALIETGSEDLQGRVAFAPEDPLGSVMDGLSFALRVDKAQATLKCRAALRHDLENKLAGLLNEASPQPLLTPPDGHIVLSANFGKPVKDVWTALGQAFGWEACTPEKWETWRSVAEGQPAAPAQMFTAVLEDAGPGMRLSWCGIDANEMIPVPELAGFFEGKNVSLEEVYASFPPAPEGTPEWESYLRYDPKAKRLQLPLPGGPSLKPTAVQTDRGLLVSTSSAVADRLLTLESPPKPLPTPGNLYLRVRPRPCIASIAEAARLLVEMNALKGYTPASFEEAVKDWNAKAGGIAEFSALVSVDQGEMLGELTLSTRLEQTGPNSAPVRQAADQRGGVGPESASGPLAAAQ